MRVPAGWFLGRTRPCFQTAALSLCSHTMGWGHGAGGARSGVSGPARGPQPRDVSNRFPPRAPSPDAVTRGCGFGMIWVTVGPERPVSLDLLYFFLASLNQEQLMF